ncbi:hypothetical protein Tco_0738108 [Tanacetum coccineum]
MRTPSTSHPLPLPTSSPPLQLLSSYRRTDQPEITPPPQKRLGIDFVLGTSLRELLLLTSCTRLIWRSVVGKTMGLSELWIPRSEDRRAGQTQIYQNVETLFDDSQYHYETARLLNQEALVSQEAWGCSIEAADRKSQVVTLEMLQADYQRQVQLTKALELLKGLQTQMVELQRQHGPAKGPGTQPVAQDSG